MCHRGFLSWRFFEQHAGTICACTAYEWLGDDNRNHNFGRSLSDWLLRMQRLLPIRLLSSRSRLSDHGQLCTSNDNHRQHKWRCRSRSNRRRVCYYCTRTRWLVSKCLVQLSCQSRRQLLPKWLRVWRAVHGYRFRTIGSATESCAELCILCLSDHHLDHGLGLICVWNCYAYFMI